MQSGFHVQDGLYFNRLEDGSVHILKMASGHAEDEEILFELTVDENVWASIISSMSKAGEGDGGFYQALHFHNSDREDYPLVDGAGLVNGEPIKS